MSVWRCLPSARPITTAVPCFVHLWYAVPNLLSPALSCSFLLSPPLISSFPLPLISDTTVLPPCHLPNPLPLHLRPSLRYAMQHLSRFFEARKAAGKNKPLPYFLSSPTEHQPGGGNGVCGYPGHMLTAADVSEVEHG